MRKNSDRIGNLIDGYLKYALIIDFIIIIVLWFINSKFELFDFIHNKKLTNINIVENIIGASISLAGFILASLTIIVAIRSNIQSKTPENANNPLELFFSVGTFKAIVRVFKIAIIELVFCFIISYVILISSENLSNFTIFKSIISLIYLISLTTIRTLFVLFLLIKVDK